MHSLLYTYSSLQIACTMKNGALSCILDKLKLVFDTESKYFRNYRS